MTDAVEHLVRQCAASLAAGDTHRTVCPFCKATHEKSFAITRDADKPWYLMFYCHRGTCASKGYVIDRQGATMVLGIGDGSSPAKKPLTERKWCTFEFLEDVSDHYDLSIAYLKMQGVRYGDGKALCMPWRNEDGAQIGWVEKRFDPTWPKSHSELSDSTAGRLAFPLVERSYHSMRNDVVCILVESLVDAYRINDYAREVGHTSKAVALLGADLTAADAVRLSRLFTHIMVLLDPDQWPKGALRVVGRFAGMPTIVRATTLQRDPKDASDAELNTVFDRCRELLCTKT